jgi:hypothetical protein
VAEGGRGALFGYAMITGNERQEPIARGSEVESIVERAAGLGSVSPLIVGFLSLEKGGERGPLRQGDLVTASALKDAGMALRPLRPAAMSIREE